MSQAEILQSGMKSKTRIIWRAELEHECGCPLGIRASSRRAVAPSQRVGFRHSDFVIPSGFDIRHSDL
jgi:hypothetical protein